MLSSRLVRRATTVAPPAMMTRSFAQSAAPAVKPLVDEAAKSTSVPRPLPVRPLPSGPQDLAAFHSMRRRNGYLGAALFLAVGGIWAYGVHAVTIAKDTFTSPDVQAIEAELEREEKLLKK